MNLDYKKCKICGEHIGMGFDHAECSKIKKDFMKTDRKKAKKKLRMKDCENFAKHINKNY